MTVFISKRSARKRVAGIVFCLWLGVCSLFAPPPSISSQPQSQTVRLGANASFSVNASGSGTLTYRWSLNGANLSNSSHISGATNAALTISNVTASDAGNYRVAITNSQGFILSSNAALIALLPPVISGVTPGAGFTNASIAIAGTNFSPNTASNLVWFGAMRANVISASATNLVVTMPTGALYAPITVIANGLVGFSPAPFLPTFFGDSPGISGATLGAYFTLPGGSGAHRTAIADLDGDGKPDLAVANAYGNTISLFRNIGSAGSLATNSFSARVDFPALAGGTDNPYGMIAADVDGDGKPDLLFADRVGNNVGVYRNLATPGPLTTNSFAAPVYFPTGTDPRYVRVRDLDGDGRPDIVSCNVAANTISILRNVGTAGSLSSGSFAPKLDLPAGTNVYDVAIQDLDGDGKPDFAVVNTGESTISLYRNLSAPGAISFAPRVDLPALANNAYIIAGDLDGDGKPELIAGGNANQVCVYRNLASAGSLTTNSFAPSLNYSTPGWVHTLALGDMNGDGKPDIIVVGELPSYLGLFQNLSTPGAITLGSRVDFTTGYNAWGVSVGDLDGDSRPDVTFCNAYDNNVSIYRNLAQLGTAPNIVSPPANTSVTVGNPAAFTVSATGTQLNYQWRFNGTNIAGATNSSFSIANTAFSDAGAYSVIISNLLGSVISSEASLSVNPAVCATAPAGLIGWWPGDSSFEDKIGTNNGTAFGGAAILPGRVNSGFSFDGVDDYITVDSTFPFHTASDATLEFWLRPGGDFGVNAYQCLFWTRASATPDQDRFNFYLKPDYTFSFDYRPSAGSPLHALVSDIPVASNAWTHLAVSRTGTTYRLYTNGVLAATALDSAPQLPTATGWRFSGLTYDEHEFKGQLDEISTYNRALTTGEIQAIFNASIAGKCPVPPSIVQQPQSAVVLVGNTISLSVVGYGTQPLSYQWFFNNTPLADAGRISGSTSATLTISAAQTNDTGDYFVIVSNSVQTATSIVANVAVGLPPGITLSPSDQTVLAGSNLLLTVVASGTEPLAYHWLLNGTPLADDAHRSGSATANLALTGVLTNDAGNYSVTVSNLFGVATSTGVVVTVWQIPVFTIQPTNQTAPAGTNVTFAVSAIGIPQVSYQWRFNGTDLPGRTNTTLLVTNIQSPSAGDYSVIASNAAGVSTSAVATLTVTPVLPYFITQPVSRAVPKGAEVLFTGSGSGSEPLTYQWLFNSNAIPGATGTLLALTNVQPADAGPYTLQITNDFGSATSTNATLTLTPPPGFLWARRGGGASTDSANATVFDAAGNLYAAGTLITNATFDGLTPTGFGNADVYLAKYDSAGRILWLRTAGSANSEVVTALAVDAAGNLIVVGAIAGVTDFGGAVLTNYGGSDSFVAKYDAAGALLWATNFGGTSTDQANGVAVDAVGNIYLTGTFAGTNQFGAITITNAGNTDAFLAKCDPNGNPLWVRRAGGTGVEQGRSVALDLSGNAYWAGEFASSTLGFGGIVLSNLSAPTAAFADVFLARLDSDGNPLWAQRAGSTSGETVRAVAVDGGGNACVFGSFAATATFGGLSVSPSSGQTADLFLARYDSSGAARWVRTVAGSSTKTAGGLALDAGGNVYLTGSFLSMVNFGGVFVAQPGAPGSFLGGTNLTSAGGSDIFVAAFSVNGNLLWALKAGGTSTEGSSGLATDNLGNLSFAGSFSTTATFGHVTQTSAGGTDAVLAKLAAFDGAAPPAFTAQPTNQTISAGANVLLTVGVLAPGPITWQWRFNGAIIPGATSLSLLLSNVTAAQSGDYSVDVTTPNGNLFSTPATLTVAVEPDFLWTKHFGGAGNDECLAVAADAVGNTYAAGYFSGTADFGGTNLVSNGGEDCFVAKFDSLQNLVWLRQIGGTNDDRATALALDGSGNLIVAGYFTGAPDFGGTNLTSAGGSDIFLAKYDGTGNLLWARQAGGVSLDTARSAAVYTNGDIAIAGAFQIIAQFESVALTNRSYQGILGSSDIFVARYNSAGQLLWAKGAGSTSPDQARGVAFDRAGNVFITGSFSGNIIFDAITLTTVRKGLDIFFAKYDAAGNAVWARTPASASSDTTILQYDDEGASVTTDDAGNAFFAGYFQGLGLFGSNYVASAASNAPDLFLTKYDGNGNILWVRTAGGAAADSGNALASDAVGNVFLAGSFAGPALFGTNNISGIGGADVFVAMYDTTGNLVKLRKAGGAGDDAAQAVAFDGRGNVVVGGYHSGAAVFGSSAVPGAGARDAFVTQISFFDPDAAPVVSTPPPSQGIPFNGTLNLGVGVTSGSPMNYQWLFNGGPLANETNAALRVTSLQYAKAGGYSVALSNAFGVVTSAVAQVTVELTPEFVWLNKAGGTGDDQALALAMDSATNLYVAGYFTGTANFTNAIAQTNVSLVSTGGTDIFLAKYNRDGHVLWARRAGGTSTDNAQTVTVDPSGNVLVAGQFNSTATFGGISLVSTGLTDIFLVKYDGNGNALWAKRFGGTSSDQATGITTDGEGNIYLTGYFVNSINLGGIVLTNYSLSPSNYFIAKLDAAGNVLWAKTALASSFGQSFGGSSGNGLALDANTNVIVTGNFQGTINFGNGVMTNLNSTTEGGTVFLAKYDRDGGLLWVRKGALSGAGIGRAVAVDARGNIFAASSKISYGTSFFLTKYDRAGSVLWNRWSVLTCCTAGNLGGYGVALDAEGNPTITGGVVENANLEGVAFSSQGFVVRYNSQGQPLWVLKTGQWGNRVALDPAGNAYLAGRFGNGVGFFGATNSLTSFGGNDAFLVKLGLKLPTAAPQVAVKTLATDSGTTLQVGTSGTGPFAYQWRFNGTNLPGATGSSLFLNGVRLTNAGLYSVVVSNPSGNSVSAPIALNVTPKIYSDLISGNLQLSWDGNFTLQSAPAPTGPFSDLVSATSPLLFDPQSGPQQFFRLKANPFTLSVSNQPNGSLALRGAGISGFNFYLQASTNLVNWTSVSTNISPLSFTDTDASKCPLRFYRAMMAQ